MFKKAMKAAVVGGAAVAAGAANAAVDPTVIDAIKQAGTDGAAIGAAVLIAVIAIFAVKLGRRAL